MTFSRSFSVHRGAALVLAALTGLTALQRASAQTPEPPRPDPPREPGQRPVEMEPDRESQPEYIERRYRPLGRDRRARWHNERHKYWYRYPGGWWRGEHPDPRGHERYRDEAYEQGWHDGRRSAEEGQREEVVRSAYDQAMDEGLAAFGAGDYSAAARHFVLAARLDQGDPASRVYAGHAMVALGRYDEALPALRRAFQLQPKLALLAIDLRREYGRPADFDAHYAALQRSAEESGDDPARWLLLGYYQFYSGREADALKSLQRSDDLAPRDFMTTALLDAARMTAPVSPSAPKATGTRGQRV